MNILQISANDLGGGAERIAWNLFEDYRSAGHQSWLAVGRKKTTNRDVIPIPNHANRNWWSRLWLSADESLRSRENEIRLAWALRRLLAAAGNPSRALHHWLGHEDFDFPGVEKLFDLPPETPQVLQCHNLHGAYFDLRMLPALSSRIPTVLTLHDAWLTTGHCAHSFGCDRWLSGCGECPDLSIYPAVRRDATARNWQVKQNIYRRSRLFVATPSRWLMDRVDRSMLGAAAVATRVIPNGVDESVFKVGDRLAARDELGLPQNDTIVLFAAVNASTNPWKDYETLRAAVAKLARKDGHSDTLFVMLGAADRETTMESARIRFVPFLKSPALVARYYQAADIYLHASRADTFPNAVLEAQACGIPVVATGVGGIPEQVSDGISGFLTPASDAVALSSAANTLINDADLRRQMGMQAVERVHRLYSRHQQSKAYMAWFEEILHHDTHNENKSLSRYHQA